MDIKKIRKAVMASRGLMSSTTDTTIKGIWNRLDPETQEAYLKKGDKNVTSVNDGKVQGSSNRTRGDGEPPDVSIPVSER